MATGSCLLLGKNGVEVCGITPTPTKKAAAEVESFSNVLFIFEF